MMECRSCGKKIEKPFMDFGSLPLPNTFVSLDNTETVKRYPLAVYFCGHCTLVQMKNQIPPEEIFSDSYKYFSSYSSELLEQSQKLCENIIHDFNLSKEARIVEVASNDGYLLNFFKKAGYDNILGVEPTLSTATIAIEKGIPTEVCFFNEETAERISKIEQADVIIANNVIAHVPDINGFTRGLSTLVKDTGIVIVEFQYVLDLIRNRLFDLMYHEHFSYFSLQSIQALMNRNGLKIIRVEKTKSQGGSLRVFCINSKVQQDPDASVQEYLYEEWRFGLNTKESYEQFSDDVHSIKTRCNEYIAKLKKNGKRLAAYGASCKGSVFLNYLGLDQSSLEYIVDKNENKQNMLLAGTDIPVYGPEKMKQSKVDLILILSWNLYDEIVAEYPDEKFFVLLPDYKGNEAKL
jgi:SAM-dependent methyltransferase